MLDYLRTTNDEVQKADVAKRIGELAERFAPDTQWFIETMNQARSPNLLLVKPYGGAARLCSHILAVCVFCAPTPPHTPLCQIAQFSVRFFVEAWNVCTMYIFILKRREVHLCQPYAPD